MPTAFPPALAKALAPFAPPQSEVHVAARGEPWANWPPHPAEQSTTQRAESNDSIRRASRVLERVGRAGA